jgi:signal transduction histidine kinase
MEPLAGLRTVLRLVARSLERGSPDQATRRALRRNLALAEKECDRLDDVARNLFDTTGDRIDASGSIDVAALAGEALELVGHELALRGVTLERRIAEVPRLRGDAAGVRQAILHLLVNAVEALPGGGTLRVEVGCDEPRRMVTLVVADDGPGIPPDRLPRIFEPFFSTKPGGSGLGLAAVRATARRHGGEVSVESQPGHGTSVRLTLPVDAPPAGALPEGAAGATAAR